MNNETEIVKFTLDPANPPKMSEETKARLRSISDKEIDFSDIPESPEDANWIRGKFTQTVDR